MQLMQKNAMQFFSDWYTNMMEKYNCVFVARPASFDWQWNKLYIR